LIKTNYFRPKLVLFLKGILFCLFIYLLISRAEKVHLSEIKFDNFWAFSGCFLLTPVNWFFEWLKWKLIVQKIDEENNPSNFRAFASGAISSFLTPSLSGNFLGRMLYYGKSKRWKITVFSTTANFSQFLVAFVFGLLALSLLGNTSLFQVHIIVVLILFILLTFLYFFGELISAQIPINQIQLVSNLINKGPSRLLFLGISLLRYVIFVSQYALALNAFGIEIAFEVIIVIPIVFLFITLSPSLFFGKIIVRESIAVAVFGLMGYATSPVIFASFTTWFFNLFLTAMISLFIVKKSS
jgi:hypothetical protein